jgi:hypothetical protein
VGWQGVRGAIMATATNPVYLDDQGNPMAAPSVQPAPTGKTYLDDQGNPMAAPQATPAQPRGVKAGGGHAASYLDMAIQNSPSGADPHNPGNPNLNAVPESERENVNDAALKTQAATLAGQGVSAGVEAAMPAGTRALTSALSYLGLGEKAAQTGGQVATGLLDPAGNPIMRAVEPEVRPVLQKLLAHPAVQKGLQTAGKEIFKGLGITAGYEIFKHLID